MRKIIATFKSIESEVLLVSGLGIGFIIGYVFAMVALLTPLGQ